MKYASGEAQKREARFRLWGFALVWIGLPHIAHAQGILPSSQDVSLSTASAHVPILIGEKVPENLIVLDANGTKRTLLSYKAAIEVLVVEFLSPGCATDHALAPDLQRFYEAYKGWHVAFVAVNLGSGDASPNGPFPVVRDATGTLARLLKVTATPEILIMDEDGILRYRGALYANPGTPEKKPHTPYARRAMDAVIGHVEPVAEPEPVVSIGCALE